MLPSSDSDIYSALRDIGLLTRWEEDEFLTRLAAERKSVRARDEKIRTSEAILRIFADGSRPEPARRAFDGVGEALETIEALCEASPELAERLEYVDEAWEWDAYEDDESREAGAELDERFGAPCALSVNWNGKEKRLTYRTLPDLCRRLNDLFREDDQPTRFYVVSQLGSGATVLVLDEERVRKLIASGILQPDDTHMSIA